MLSGCRRAGGRATRTACTRRRRCSLVALRRGEVAVFAGAALEARFTAVGNLGATLRAAEHEVSVAAGNGPRLSLAFKVTDCREAT